MLKYEVLTFRVRSAKGQLTLSSSGMAVSFCQYFCGCYEWFGIGGYLVGKSVVKSFNYASSL